MPLRPTSKSTTTTSTTTLSKSTTTATTAGSSAQSGSATGIVAVSDSPSSTTSTGANSSPSASTSLSTTDGQLLVTSSADGELGTVTGTLTGSAVETVKTTHSVLPSSMEGISANATANGSSDSSSSGIPAGGWAGIVIVLVAVLASLGWYFARRLRNKGGHSAAKFKNRLSSRKVDSVELKEQQDPSQNSTGRFRNDEMYVTRNSPDEPLPDIPQDASGVSRDLSLSGLNRDLTVKDLQKPVPTFFEVYAAPVPQPQTAQFIPAPQQAPPATHFIPLPPPQQLPQFAPQNAQTLVGSVTPVSNAATVPVTPISPIAQIFPVSPVTPGVAGDISIDISKTTERHLGVRRSMSNGNAFEDVYSHPNNQTRNSYAGPLQTASDAAIQLPERRLSLQTPFSAVYASAPPPQRSAPDASQTAPIPLPFHPIVPASTSTSNLSLANPFADGISNPVAAAAAVFPQTRPVSFAEAYNTKPINREVFEQQPTVVAAAATTAIPLVSNPFEPVTAISVVQERRQSFADVYNKNDGTTNSVEDS
ncbi:hypothetical protein HK100_002387, partial [Physocladia obscura]